MRVQACADMDEAVRVHEMCPRAQARHRQGHAAMDRQHRPHMVWMRA